MFDTASWTLAAKAPGGSFVADSLVVATAFVALSVVSCAGRVAPVNQRPHKAVSRSAAFTPLRARILRALVGVGADISLGG